MHIKDIAREDDGERQELVLTVVASPEDVKASSDEFFKQIAQRDIPGFRKGKAPRAILEQSVGGHLNAMGGVAETLINELAFQAIDNADVIFISEPQFNVDGVIEEGEPFTFTVSGEVAPVMTLTDYSPVQIEMPPEEATEKEIDDQIEQLRDYYHSFEDIEDENHVAADGDYVMATVTITKSNGRPLPGLNNASRMLGLGDGNMPPSFDEHIIGSHAGDTLDFDFEIPVEEDGDEEPMHHAVVEVQSFRTRVLPALDDEFAQKLGCTDVDDMYAQVRRTINMQKAQELPRVMVDRAVSKLIERLDGEVPEYYVNFIRQDVGREFMRSLEQQGTNLQQWMLDNSVKGDEVKAEVEQEALRRASIDCALEALFIEKDLQITDEDIDAMFDKDGSIDESRESWEKACRMSDVRKMCRQAKATAWLVDNADVTVVEDSSDVE